MNSKAFFVLASFIVSAFAQTATIAVPAPGSTLVAGSQITIEVDQSVSIFVFFFLDHTDPLTNLIPGIHFRHRQCRDHHWPNQLLLW